MKNNHPENKTVTLGELITSEEAADLIACVRRWRSLAQHSSIHNRIMKWLDCNPRVLKKFATAGLLKSYGAYMLEYVMEIRD